MNEEIENNPSPRIEEEVQAPLKTLEQACVEEETVNLTFRVPQEKVPDITLQVSKSDFQSLTFESIKKLISEQHPFKPDISKQRILFGGKLLQNEAILGDLLQGKDDETYTFHLMIFTKKQPEEEKKEEQKQPRREQQAPDQIFLTKKFKNYEQKLMKEYLKTLKDVKLHTYGQKSEIFGALIDSGTHNTSSKSIFNQFLQESQVMNTNLSQKENVLLSHLPIMSRQFQERLNSHISERNLSINGENAQGQLLNRNLQNLGNVRTLGYDSMFQFTLLAKLMFFMIFFGMNTEKKYRWMTLAFVVSYYFYHVRDVYIEHYNSQRRILALEPQEGLPGAQELIENVLGNRAQQNVGDAPLHHLDQGGVIPHLQFQLAQQRNQPNLMLPGHSFDQRTFDYILPDYNNFLVSSQQQAHSQEHLTRQQNFRNRTNGQHLPLTQPIAIEPELNWYETLQANGFNPLYILRIAYVVIVHFVMSLHNGWIDPRLRMYDQINANREQARQQRNENIQNRQQEVVPEQEEEIDVISEEDEIIAEVNEELQEGAADFDLINLTDGPQMEEQDDLFGDIKDDL